MNVCTEEPLQSNRCLLGVFSGCYLEPERSLTYTACLWATWSYLAILSVEQHQHPVGTCKKCRVIGPDLVIHNSGDRGQCNNPKTVAHTEVWRSSVGQSTDTELSLETGSLTIRPQSSQVGMWLEREIRAVYVSGDIYGHTDCIQSG